MGIVIYVDAQSQQLCRDGSTHDASDMTDCSDTVKDFRLGGVGILGIVLLK